MKLFPFFSESPERILEGLKGRTFIEPSALKFPFNFNLQLNLHASEFPFYFLYLTPLAHWSIGIEDIFDILRLVL